MGLIYIAYTEHPVMLNIKSVNVFATAIITDNIVLKKHIKGVKS
jgi:hypothetical protein